MRLPHVLLCYRYIAWPSLVITFFTGALLWQAGNAYFLINLFWTKLITTGLLVAYIWLYRRGDFFFFLNAGLSIRAFFVGMVLPDLLVATLTYTIVLATV